MTLKGRPSGCLQLPWLLAPLILPLCSLLSACAWHGAIKDNFDGVSAQPSSHKLRYKVAVFANNPSAPITLYLQRQNFYIRLDPGLNNAVKSLMAELFDEVVEVRSAKEAEDCDYLAIGAVNAAGASIFFQDPKTAELVALFGRLYPASSTSARPSLLPTMAATFTFGILYPAMRASEGRNAAALLERGISQVYAKIAQDIIQDQKLWNYPILKAEAESAEQLGDQALKENKNLEALAAYAYALRNTYYGTFLDARIREKYLKLAPGLANKLPRIPNEARHHLHKGVRLFKQAEDDTELGSALSETRRALNLAPWWSDAYYNLALIHDALEDRRSAVLNYRFYLLSNPKTSDVEDVYERIAKLEANGPAR